MFSWDALQRQCEISKDIVDITEPCLNREFQREEQKSFHTLKIFVFLHDLDDMEGHAKKCVERYCE